MAMLADLTLERFIKIAHDEGIINDERLEELWMARPLEEPFIESALRKTFRDFREAINAGRELL